MTINQLKVTLRCVAVASAALLVASSAWAQPQVDGRTLSFSPQFEVESAVLTMSGMGQIWEQRIDGRSGLFFELYGPGGEALPDGPYSWELRLVPAGAGQVRSLDDNPTGTAPRRDDLVYNGFFRLHNGAIPSADEVEPRPEGPAESSGAGTELDREIQPNDFVIADDLIVDGSACIGFDCVNGESFGFDTIRLKENNLRIKFDDTSVAASFPRTDWQLTANESANGGLGKFSIDDISGGRTPFTVEANAPSNSLYVDDGGRIGNGTSIPVAEMHIVDGDTPTLRLEQDGSSGFAPQTWDVAGNETSFFIRDATNGSTLPFRIRPGSPSNALNIDVDGQVGVGVLSPDTTLQVQAVDAELSVVDSNGATGGRNLLTLTNNGTTRMTFDNTNAPNGWINSAANGGAFNMNADDGDADTEFILTAAGDLTLTGTITVPGGTLPDYVFEPDYKLMPLADVKAFVTENKHLPGIPSQADVTAVGLNMTEMQKKLLEKVEELTLYTLAQQETIEQLRARLDALTPDSDSQ